ncbi:MAG: metal-dependent transcriptional regulator, partial [Pseudolysinimonas sp.]
LDWAYVHDEACRWEHVMSEQVERRVLEMLDHPTESPYGNPIPGLAELGDAPAPAFMDGVVNIVDLVASTSGTVSGVIRRLGEPVQFEPELLQQLQAAGVMPGATASISAAGSYVSVQVDGFGDGLELPNEVAVHIFVAA